jgi:hypothetical protein
MEAHEQLRERAADDRLRGREHAAAEDEAVRQRELEDARDEDGLEVSALGDDPDRVHCRHGAIAQLDQQAVLAFGDALRQLLQRVVRAVQADEPDDVAADAACDVDDEVLGPLLERQAPWEAEKCALIGAGDQPKVISGGNGGDL